MSWCNCLRNTQGRNDTPTWQSSRLREKWGGGVKRQCQGEDGTRELPPLGQLAEQYHQDWFNKVVMLQVTTDGAGDSQTAVPSDPAQLAATGEDSGADQPAATATQP